MNLSIRNLSWQQLATFALCLIAAFAAHKFLGLTSGMTAGFVTSIVAFLMGRDGPPPPPAVAVLSGPVRQADTLPAPRIPEDAPTSPGLPDD